MLPLLILRSSPASSRDTNGFLCILSESFAFHTEKLFLCFNESHLSLVLLCWGNNFLYGKRDTFPSGLLASQHLKLKKYPKMRA